MSTDDPRASVRFATKVAVVVADDLAPWQELNVTAFLVSGIAGVDDEVIGEPYRSADGLEFRPMLREPVFVFGADRARVRRAFERALDRDVRPAVFTQELFATGHDAANRAAVGAVPTAALDLVGIAVRAERRTVDAIVRGLKLHA